MTSAILESQEGSRKLLLWLAIVGAIVVAHIVMFDIGIVYFYIKLAQALDAWQKSTASIPN
jgi:TRAP-type C4-dicarboxylate transport system permease small subunit